MRMLLLIGTLSAMCLPCDAKTKEAVKAVDLPKAIFTGENLKTEADLRSLIEAIKITPKGAVFSAEQLKGMKEILVALQGVAASEKIKSISFSVSCDLFAALDATLAGKRAWQKFRDANPGDSRLIELGAVVAAVQASR